MITALRVGDRVELTFPYSPPVIEVLKLVAGSKFVPERKIWSIHVNAAGVLADLIAARKLGKINWAPWTAPVLPPTPGFVAAHLRPYQQDGVNRLLSHRGYAITFDPRVGKTITTIGALGAAFAAGRASRALVLYPNQVRAEWKSQLARWGMLTLSPLEGRGGTPDHVIARWNTPFTVIGCHHEILADRGGDLLRWLNSSAAPTVIIADELHQYQNPKAPRSKYLLELSHHASVVHSWALTGTPMRNRPKNMWVFFDFLGEDSVGSFSKFGARYCDGHTNDHGFWNVDGSSNEDELKARLAACSYRLTRADVAQHLPPTEVRTILCEMSAADAKAYGAAERAFAPNLARIFAGTEATGRDFDALKALAAQTVKTKVGAAVDRIREHTEGRGVKILVSAAWHETLHAMWEKLVPAEGKPLLDAPVFCAGGWMLADKRNAEIARWKACPGPAILLTNIIASGVGIDLSDADTAIALEPTWVPSDFVQWMARIVDVHQGKRTSPPLYEVMLTKGTLDEDMVVALLGKIDKINAIVGADAALAGLGGALRRSGVGGDRVSIGHADPEIVRGVLARMRARMLGADSAAIDSSNLQLAAELGEAYEEEVTGEEQENERPNE